MTTTTTTRAITARLKAALRAFANKAPRTRRARPALLAIPTLALACSLTAAAAPHAAAANTSVTPAAGHAVASVGCYSSTCVDQGPQEMGCTADAQTVRYREVLLNLTTKVAGSGPALQLCMQCILGEDRTGPGWISVLCGKLELQGVRNSQVPI